MECGLSCMVFNIPSKIFHVRSSISAVARMLNNFLGSRLLPPELWFVAVIGAARCIACLAESDYV
jgi:hypothetical protein